MLSAESRLILRKWASRIIHQAPVSILEVLACTRLHFLCVLSRLKRIRLHSSLVPRAVPIRQAGTIRLAAGQGGCDRAHPCAASDAVEGLDWRQADCFQALTDADRGVVEAPKSVVFLLDARTHVRYQQSMCLDLARLASSEGFGSSRVWHSRDGRPECHRSAAAARRIGARYLYLGRRAANKRVDMLLFVARLHERGCSPRPHIVGEDYLGELRQKVSQLGLAKVGDLRIRCTDDLAPESSGNASSSSPPPATKDLACRWSKSCRPGLLPSVHANTAFQEFLEDANVGFLADFDRPEQCADQFIEWLPASTIRCMTGRENSACAFRGKLSSGLLEVCRQVLGTQAQMSYTLEPSRRSILLKEKGEPGARTL
jgi:hypothetical protein